MSATVKARIDHIGIAVSDLGDALAFYRDALGLEIDPAEDVPSQRVRAHFIRMPGGESAHAQCSRTTLDLERWKAQLRRATDDSAKHVAAGQRPVRLYPHA